jgi:hypothetical protein
MNIRTIICANPYCLKDFETINSKQKFCCLYCKNQAAYWHKQKFYKWEVEIQKGRLNNIRILEELIQRKHNNVNSNELLKMGFDFKIALVPDRDEMQRFVYRFGNLYLIRKSSTDLEIAEVSKIRGIKNENN